VPIFDLCVQHLFMALPRLVFLVMALIVLMILVGAFFFYHIYLLVSNQTTNERHKLGEMGPRGGKTDVNASRSLDKPVCDTGENLVHSQISDYKNGEDVSNVKTDLNMLSKKMQRRPYRPYSRGVLYNVQEVFLPHNFIMSRIKHN